MSKTDIKKEKDLFKDLNKLYEKDKPFIINWLIEITIESSHSNKIVGLLNNSKIQINTTSEYGVYNMILKWFLNNKDKFKGNEHLFEDIPSTTFIKISSKIMSNTFSPNTEIITLDMDDALKKWKEDPTIDPFTNKKIKISIVPTSKYGELYETFCNHLSYNQEIPILPIVFEKEIRNKLPNNHIYVFKDIDYIDNIKFLYPDEEWINFLYANKKIFYKKEQVNDLIGSTVYDFLFMHFFLI